jgi:hypothetical protein
VQKHALERHLSNAQELLTVMSNEEVKPEMKKPHKTYWQQILTACFGILAIAALGKGFLYLEAEISTAQSTVGSAVKDLTTLKAQVSATDTREQIAIVTTELENLKTTNTQFWAEVQQLREIVDALKAKKTNVSPAQRKRR